MRLKHWMLLASAFPIAAARQARADFDPLEASWSAVARYHRESRVDRLSAPEGCAVGTLEGAVETILEMPARGR
jgi:hypothetical protein